MLLTLSQVIDMTLGLRLSEKDEAMGADAAEHGLAYVGDSELAEDAEQDAQATWRHDRVPTISRRLPVLPQTPAGSNEIHLNGGGRPRRYSTHSVHSTAIVGIP